MADVGQEDVSSFIPLSPQPSHLTNIIKDFVAAEKKALKVGAKKFFVEVRLDDLRYEQYQSIKNNYCIGSQTRVRHRTHLPSRSSQLYLRGMISVFSLFVEAITLLTSFH